ncbi:MAG: ABC transporter ATP-binding protein [Bacteroidales bacterium]|nr:ABC transporter ATP-binding protein [Bacteroidales bacterium]
MNRVEVKALHKNFDQLKALENIDFNVEEGEIFGIIGPDGAGKTTLFRILVTLLLPSHGEVCVCGYDAVKDFRKVREIIGYMPGRFSLYQDLSVEENLEFYATVFGTTIKQNYDLIKDIYKHIEPFKKRKARALSGGMKQKLALSCALIHRPEVLILDEPTTGVDAVSRKEFWDMLYKIKKEGITILVSTPYMDEAGRCDKVALMQKGRILSLSKPEQIPGSFKKPLYSVKTNISNYRFLREVREKPWCKSAWLFGQEIHICLNENSQMQIFEDEMKIHPEVKRCREIKPGIEDTFIELMN